MMILAPMLNPNKMAGRQECYLSLFAIFRTRLKNYKKTKFILMLKDLRCYNKFFLIMSLTWGLFLQFKPNFRLNPIL
jgi:hypothetical protein